jgi:RNA-directed DNA polymerase
VDIPKPQGGVRTLGIPTLTDRLIQQALHQVLTPIFEAGVLGLQLRLPSGAEARIRRSRRRSVCGGGPAKVVVDIDLEKFFDRVNHDLLLRKLSRQDRRRRCCRLIRRYLEAGMMADGRRVARGRRGTPQGGPLSPLLSNILLTELDRELEKRRARLLPVRG